MNKTEATEDQTNPGPTCQRAAACYVDLLSIEHDLVELVGCKFHQIDEHNKGKLPAEYNLSEWINKYKGKQDLPPYTVELNSFRYEVNAFVAMILSVIKRHT